MAALVVVPVGAFAAMPTTKLAGTLVMVMEIVQPDKGLRHAAMTAPAVVPTGAAMAKASMAPEAALDGVEAPLAICSYCCTWATCYTRSCCNTILAMDTARMTRGGNTTLRTGGRASQRGGRSGEAAKQHGRRPGFVG
jgi:hypothetical protein